MGSFFKSAQIVLSELHWYDIIDILLIAYIIYKLFTFIRDSRASLIFKGVLIIALAYLASVFLNLQMVSTVVELIVRYASIAIIVVFQPEIRNMLEHMGRSRLKVGTLFGRSEQEIKRAETLNTISCVVESARLLQKQCMGALIVFEREVTLQEIIVTGTQMDAAPNVSLIANIFYNKAPLHDGAMVIRGNRICAASCILPLTQKTDIDPSFGTRHRAAIGMCENSDAVVVVVSEETGRISVACNGEIESSYDAGELSTKLLGLLLPESLDELSGSDKPLGSRIVSRIKKSSAERTNSSEKQMTVQPDIEQDSEGESTEYASSAKRSRKGGKR